MPPTPPPPITHLPVSQPASPFLNKASPEFINLREHIKLLGRVSVCLNCYEGTKAVQARVLRNVKRAICDVGATAFQTELSKMFVMARVRFISFLRDYLTKHSHSYDMRCPNSRPK